MSIRIAIVDDHRIVRDGIKLFLLGDNRFDVMFEAATGEQLKQMPSDAYPDLVLLDIMLPDISGLDLIPFLIDNFKCKIILLTAEKDEDVVCEAINRGADGFLNKDVSCDELINAMLLVLSGEPYFGESISNIVYRSYKKKLIELKDLKEMPTITVREKEIIHLLSDGLSFKEIGEKLFISPRTAENHKNNLLQKLELKNTIELIKYAFKHNIVEL